MNGKFDIASMIIKICVTPLLFEKGQGGPLVRYTKTGPWGVPF